MKAFAQLFADLDETTKTNRKVEALAGYFQTVPPADGAWAVFFLSGRTLKRLIKRGQMVAWGSQAANVPTWLFDESYHAVGDLAETISLLLPTTHAGTDLPLHHWIEDVLLRFPELGETGQRDLMVHAWSQLSAVQCFVWNKIITGSFRVGVSATLVARGLAQAFGLDVSAITQRLMGDWQPTEAFFERLRSPDVGDAPRHQPYPFMLAPALEDPVETLGALRDWQAEWKWDGIRAQLLRRGGEVALWSRGEEILTNRFPEIVREANKLPEGTVFDGEILAWKDGRVRPFADLQRRIGRTKLGPKILRDVPVCFQTFDLLEHEGQDVRALPLAERRRLLQAFPWAGTALRLAPLVTEDNWADLAEKRLESRGIGVEGLMLKRLDSPYGMGRVHGPWWKWKIDPYTIDAVMLYAQLGHGRRASLYTDYTFGLWHEGELLPFAKAYSGLSDEEIRAVDRWVRQNTVARFGPVRHVPPVQVFELAFEGIQQSPRHRAGVAVRFPRILRWRKDKTPEQADSLEQLRRWLPAKAEVPAGESMPFLYEDW